MGRIVIVGGGFAGLAALDRLGSQSERHDILVIDQRPHFEFLPLLPDVVGRRLPHRYLRTSIGAVAARAGARFVQDVVTGIDGASRRVITRRNSFPYDAVLLASGTQTDFYGNDDLTGAVYKLDCVEDASRIAERADKGDFANIVVVGGGYTGIEIATGMRRRLRSLGRGTPIHLVEMKDSLIPSLPSHLRGYCRRNCKRMDVRLRLHETLEAVRDGDATLRGGEVIERAMVIWSAGVHTPSYVRNLDYPQAQQGRLQVDQTLAVADSVFAAGDTAAFRKGEAPLRLAVQFSITEGQHAADNLVRYLDGHPLEPYNPFDPGYVVPMANNLSCGTPLGISVTGVLPTALHYFMSVFRSRGLENRLGILHHLFYGKS